MDDFNADNKKTDEAIKAVDDRVGAEAARLDGTVALAGAAELLRSGVSGGTVSSIYLSVSGVDWSRYSLAVFTLSAPSNLNCTFSSGAGGSFQSGGYPSWEGGKLMDISGVPFASILMPVGRSGDSHVRTFGMSHNTYFGIANTAIKNVGSFYVQMPSGSLYFPSGTQFSMWGVR